MAQLTQEQYEKALEEYNAAQSELVEVNKILTQIGGNLVYKGKTYTRPELTKLSTSIQKKSNAAKETKDAAEKFIASTQKELASIDKRMSPTTFAGQTQPQEVSATQKKALASKKTKLEKQLADFRANVVAEAPTGTVAPTAPAPKPATGTGSARQFETTQGATPAPAQPSLTPTPSAAGGTPGTAGTSGTTTGKGKGGKGGKKGKPAQDWAPIVQQEFGSLWDVYTSNPDVKTVLDKAVQEGWFNDEIKLTEALRNTSWFKTTERSARQFSIRQSTDPAQINDEIDAKTEELRQQALANGFTFDDSTLRTLATNQIKYGWSTQQTTNAVGSEAVAQAQAGGGRGMADLRSGYVGQNLRKIAQSYAQKPSEAMVDMWIQDIMTGKKTDVQWTETMRESAKTQFRSLQPALDKGQDVETALYAYKQQAQSILGNVTDVSEIDWTSDKWNKALNYRDEKTNEFRQMDLWEWNKYLRTLPEWQQTDEAKNTYSNVAYTLAQGFGKIA